MPTPAQVMLLTGTENRRDFLASIKSIVGGGNIRSLWLPSPGDLTTTLDEDPSKRVWTYDGSINARKSTLGQGVAVSFNGTSQFAQSPDTNDVSFGNGVTDSPFSVFTVANVTDTAAARYFLAKWDVTGTKREWFWSYGATDLATLGLYTETVDKAPSRAGNAAGTQAGWATMGATYDGTGGATAANGILIYQAGAAVASTATNDALYVAMENQTTVLSLGASDMGAAANFFAGSMALSLLVAGALSANQMAQLHTLCKSYFNI